MILNQQVADIFSSNAQRIIQLLSIDGGEGRFVGGCVRDFLLNKPYYDIDIATTHTPQAVTKLLQQRDIKVIPTGISHGTVTAVLEGQHFEITTLRKDVECDGRHAQVEYTNNWQEDAARRDFTINALYIDGGGDIYDYYDGQRDIEQRIIRFVGDPQSRITEDYLRILRMFRFQAYYSKEFTLPEQLQVCKHNLKGLTTLSGERIQAEMLKILSAPKPLYVLTAMNKIGVFNYLIPNLNSQLNLDGLKELAAIEARDTTAALVNPYTRLAAMLILGNHEPAKIQTLAEYWKLSSDDRNFLSVILSQDHHIRSDMDEPAAKCEIRLLTKDYFIGTALVRWAAECYFCDGKYEPINNAYKDLIELAQTWKTPIMPIRGRDLIEMGVGEGQEVGALLKLAEQEWEAKDYRPTRDELLALVKAELIA